MEPSIIIELPGQPRGKGRPRSMLGRRRDGSAFIGVYSDDRTRAYELALAKVAKIAMRARAPLTGALSVMIEAFFYVPKSWPEKRRDRALAGGAYHCSKPDFDNVAKNIDALKGIVWTDDSQVVDAIVRKRYSEKPRLRISVRHLEGELFDAGGEERDTCGRAASAERSRP